jgi:hypothetical protein
VIFVGNKIRVHVAGEQHRTDKIMNMGIEGEREKDHEVKKQNFLFPIRLFQENKQRDVKKENLNGVIEKTCGMYRSMGKE